MIVQASPKPKSASRTGIVVRARKLRDTKFDNFFTEVQHRWDYSDFVDGEQPDWMNDWISFDSVLADDQRGKIWCGLTHFPGDIFWEYDRASRKFTSLGFQSVGDKYDAKFHRALTFDKHGAIWAATALLHDVDRYNEAPGGAIVRFDPDSRKIEIVVRPIPHVYIQSIVLDQDRGILYGQTFTPEKLFAFDLESKKCTELGAIGSGFSMGQGETLAIDRNGNLWGTWTITRAWLGSPGGDQYRLWRYHPQKGKIEYLKYGLPTRSGGGGFAHADGVHTGPDGAVYMGTAEGLLCRIDPDSGKVNVIGKPGPHTRLAGMANGPDGNLYGSAGRDGSAVLFRYNPKTEELSRLGSIFDPTIGENAYQIHDMSICRDGTIYLGENDVPYRSGYLWEVTGAM